MKNVLVVVLSNLIIWELRIFIVAYGNIYINKKQMFSMPILVIWVHSKIHTTFKLSNDVHIKLVDVKR